MPIKRARGRTLSRTFAQRKRRNVAKVLSRPYRMRSNLARTVRAIALKNCEAKRNFIQTEGVALYHNTNQLNTNLLATNLGTQQHQRIGDEVVGQYLTLKFWLSNKPDRPNVMYRIIVYSSSLSDAQLYFANGASANRMISTIDTDKVKILKHRLIRPPAGDYSLESGATNKERSTMVSMCIRLKNRKIKYNSDAGSTPKWQGNYIHFVVIPYDAYGSLTTDNIASYSWQSCFTFKDP